MSEFLNRRNFLKLSALSGISLTNMSLLSNLLGCAPASEGEFSSDKNNTKITSDELSVDECWASFAREFEEKIVPMARQAAGSSGELVDQLLNIQRQAIVALRNSSQTMIDTYVASRQHKGQNFNQFVKENEALIREWQQPTFNSLRQMEGQMASLKTTFQALVPRLNPAQIASKQQELVRQLLERPELKTILSAEAQTAISGTFSEISNHFAKAGYEGLFEEMGKVMTWARRGETSLAAEDEVSPIYAERMYNFAFLLLNLMIDGLCGWIPVYIFWDICVQLVSQSLASPIVGVLIMGFMPSYYLWWYVCPDTSECSKNQIMLLNTVFVINAIALVYLGIQKLYHRLTDDPIHPATTSSTTSTSQTCDEDLARLLRPIYG
jgi:hypothetical protein